MTYKDKGSYESSPPCNMRHRERTKGESDVTTFLVWHDCLLAVVWHDCLWHCVTTTKYMTISFFLSLITTSTFMCVTGRIHVYESWLIHIYSCTHPHVSSYTHAHVSSYTHSYIIHIYTNEYMKRHVHEYMMRCVNEYMIIYEWVKIRIYLVAIRDEIWGG